MKIKLILITPLLFCICAGSRLLAAPIGTAISYSGSLAEEGLTANGFYDMKFRLYTNISIGPPATGILLINNLDVSRGLFSVELDFGPGVFDGTAYWMEVQVKKSTVATFTTLTPRQPLYPTPYALWAARATNADVAALASSVAANAVSGGAIQPSAITAGKIAVGQVVKSLNALQDDVLLAAGANVTITPLGNTLTLASVGTGNDWHLAGNAGTTPGTDFLGTTDNQPLEFKVNGLRSFRLEPNADEAPNVIGGAAVNFVGGGMVGSTIGGGGAANYAGFSLPNSIFTDFGTISGGRLNTIRTGANSATIGGGAQNTIQATASGATIGGGALNTIQPNAYYATIAGGDFNMIEFSADYSTIGGGGANGIGTNASHSTIAGGYGNSIQSNAPSSTIGGGEGNTIQTNGGYATIPGGSLNSATNFAFAAGRRAKANHTGAFVWADSQNADFVTTAIDQFTVRAAGGVRLETGGAGATLDGQPLIWPTYGGAVTLNNPANVFGGNGAALVNLNASELASGTVPATVLGNAWKIGGNAGTTAGVNFLGTTDNQPLELWVNGLRALRLEPGASGKPNVIGGNSSVAAGLDGAVVGGGYGNSIAANSSGATIAGGRDNKIGANSFDSVISGGTNNIIADDSPYSTTAGGVQNAIGMNSLGVVIGGGGLNNIGDNSALASISGGALNVIGTNSTASTIGGGYQNAIADSTTGATIAAGYANVIGSNSPSSAIAGGTHNHIGINTEVATIAGGAVNDIGTNSNYSAIGGGYDNNIADNSFNSTIAGGSGNNIGASSYSSAIGGGTNNAIAANSPLATISGGLENSIGTNSSSSVIGGGYSNDIADNSFRATIAGGFFNNIGTNSHTSTIGGGKYHNIAANAFYATIAGGVENEVGLAAASATVSGGSNNVISADATAATISGGSANNISNNAVGAGIGAGEGNLIEFSANDATIAGGFQNSIQLNADGAVIAGGGLNTNAASYSTIPGGRLNLTSGNYAFAAGRQAKATNGGAFVWADGAGVDLTSTNNNSWTARASGGYRLFSNGGASAGVFLAPGGTSWSAISDRNAKKNFTPVDGQEVLAKLAAVPVQKWNYKWEADDAVPNIGPMAQDFKAAFYPGRDDKSITTQEIDGVALAAIQGLNQKLDERDTEIQQLKKAVSELKGLMKQLTERQH